MPIMGIDVGTTGCKASLFHESGSLLAHAYREYPTEHPFPGAYELNPQLVWQSVLEVIAEASAAAPQAQVRAISVSSLGEAVVPIDRQGAVLGPAILYMDARGKDEAAALERSVGGERIMALTGVPPHPMFSLPKIMWMKRHRPELYRSTYKFLLFGSFVAYRLTGATVTDYSLASRTMAFNIHTKRWDAEIIGAADIDPGKLPEPIASGQIIGPVRLDFASSLGLSPDTLVVSGGHDQACAALGAGILSAGRALDGIGTVECITPAYAAPIADERMLRHHYNCAPHVVDGLYLTYAFNFTGGSLLRWYRDSFGHAAAAEARKRGINAYDYMNAAASPQPTDLYVIPHFAGSGTPSMNPEAKGAIYGLTFETTPAEIYRALLEGVTYEMKVNMDCLREAGIAIDSLRAVGGGAKSELWLQIKADIMGCPIEKLDVDEAGTLGSIMLAGKASGLYASYDEAVGALVKPVRTFEPNASAHSLYRERYERYKAIAAAIASVE